VARASRYLSRAVDQHGQTVDAFISKRCNIAAATSFFKMMLAGRELTREVTTDLAAPSLRVLGDLLPEALHGTTHFANNRIECDHRRLKARLRPMRRIRTDQTASTMLLGHAFIQNLRRNYY
jgi:transposase, IS6 family